MRHETLRYEIIDIQKNRLLSYLKSLNLKSQKYD